MEALVPLLTLYLQVLVLNYSLMEVVVMVVVHPGIICKNIGWLDGVGVV